MPLSVDSQEPKKAVSCFSYEKQLVDAQSHVVEKNKEMENVFFHNFQMKMTFPVFIFLAGYS